MNVRYKLWIGGLILVSALFSYCGEEVMPEEFLDVRDLEAFDNGNNGNGSDIEVFFDKQNNSADVGIYRIYVIKAEASGSNDLVSLISLDESRYETVLPKDIFPIQGKTLSSNLMDVDGDLIQEDVAYRVAIITMPADEALWSPTLTISSETVTLSHNSLVSQYSRDLESGYGDIAMNGEGTLFMSSYNIIDDLFGGASDETPLYTFSNSGRETVVLNYTGILGGNAFNADNVLFQSVIDRSEVLRITPDGSVSVIPFGDERIVRPDGIYVNDADEIFLVDNETGTVYTITEDGNASRFATVGENARGITGDEDGNLYVSINDEAGQIMKIDPSGVVTEFAQIRTFKPDDYDLPYLMWLGYMSYHDGYVYVPSVGANQIYRVSLTGEVELFAGSGRRLFPKGDIKNAHFNRPMSIRFSDDGQTAFVNGCLDVTPLHTQASFPAKLYTIEIAD